MNERQVAAEALRQVADDLDSITQGPNGEALRLWPQHDRNIYSLAIEEASAQIYARANEIEFPAETNNH